MRNVELEIGAANGNFFEVVLTERLFRYVLKFARC